VKNYLGKGLMISMMLLGATLCGCTSLGKFITPTTVEIAQIAIDTAVGAVLGPDTVAAKATAVAIKSIATQLLAADTGSSVAIGALATELTTEIDTKLKLTPTEQLAANALVQIVATLVPNILAQTSSTATTPASAPSAKVAIATVLQQIINATAAYGV